MSEKKDYYQNQKKQITMAFKKQVQYLNRQWSQYCGRIQERKNEFIDYYRVQDIIEIN